MTRALSHRGPDGEGIYISPDGKVGLGHRRLKIIDLSDGGAQPMSYNDRYWITFNGEIYNYQTERALLEQKGYRFSSHSDTEVILALYDAYQEQCVHHLRGMFAFAIYNSVRRTLFCARDRLGKKPFYFASLPTHFIFGSEIKAILTQGEYFRKPDEVALGNYLTFGYCPAPATGFAGIQKLEPGHTLTVDIDERKIVKNRYWHRPQPTALKLPIAEWKKQIRDTLTEAIKLRLVADVPLGALLSGGLDSSIVVGLMAQASSTPVRTFSIGFAEEKFNELPYARLVAERFGTDHTELVVPATSVEIAHELAAQFDEPFADSSALPTYLLSKLTKQHVTVALTGDGGDELFGGYRRYQWFRYLSWLRYGGGVPGKLVHRLATALQAATPATRWQRLKDYTHVFRQVYKPAEQYRDIVSLFPATGARSFEQYFTGNDIVGDAMRVDIATYLPDDLLAKLDITSMAHGLEVRSPFLDHIFVESVAALPTALKMPHGGKWILKETFKNLVPAEIIQRPKKGFALPLETWLTGDVMGYVRSVLQSPAARARVFYEHDTVAALLAAHGAGKGNYAPQLWALLMLELWWQRHFD